MKPKYVFIFILNILVSIGLVIAVVVLFSKEQEKERMIQDLEIQRQTELRKAVQARQEVEVQKEFESQIRLEAQKQSEAKRTRTINDDLDKIDTRLQRVLDVPSGYADQTKAQRDTQEELLRQLANGVKAEISVLSGEMQSAGFTNNAVLDERLAMQDADQIYEEVFGVQRMGPPELIAKEREYLRQLAAPHGKVDPELAEFIEQAWADAAPVARES